MNDQGSGRPGLIAAAQKVLAGKDKSGRLAVLAEDLFARVGAEDLAVYDADEIAGFVRAAEALLQVRAPGETIVRIVDPAGDGILEDISVIEALNDNMPFLVDSALGEIRDFGAEVRLVAHPMVSVERDRAGRLTAYLGTAPAPTPAIRESLMQIHVDRLRSEEAREALSLRLASLFAEVRVAVADWPAMVARLREAIAIYKAAAPIGDDDVAETAAFLEWLSDDNFTFLGVREYDFVGGTSRGELRRADKSGLGILRDPEVRVLRRGKEGVTTTPAIREFLMRSDPLIVTKSNLKSRIHRRAYMDYIGLKLFGKKGALAGEVRFVGLFTSTAYTRSVRAIPYLRRKAANIMARAGFDPASHSGKALANVLESYPRDELFQIDDDTLFDFAMAIMALDERPRVRVLARRDKFDRFVSALVFVPRDHYDSDIRKRIGDYLATVFDGHVSAFYPAFLEGALTRVHFIIGRAEGTTPNPDQATLEAAVSEIIRSWVGGLEEAIRAKFDPVRAEALVARYRDAFPVAYRDAFTPEAAVGDIETFETLSPERPIWASFHSEDRGAPHALALALIHLAEPIALSSRVPMLENMGFTVIDEQTFEILPAGGPSIYMHDMTLEPQSGVPLDLERAAPLLTASFMAVWYRLAESDGYNALTAGAHIAWRDVALLRSVSRFLHQAGLPYPQHYMWQTLNRHPEIAKALVELFHARFSPTTANERAAAKWTATIEAALEGVQSLDEDRIVRRFLGVIAAMVRTNFFQPAADGAPHEEITFKLDSKRIEDLPAPRPFREIFLHSPRVDGVHLRFGKVARGGIRWSDRPQDFRTEVLGLVKAQQVKNAVIVPVGAKGGFVPKRLPAGGDRAAIMAEGTAAYRIFISSLLDITDNLDGDTVIPPEAVLRPDGDDPYLVVAADKGTATFSDTANAIAEAHDFWLGDAFASGGSVGYDHKTMGITARGAWEAVKRHFREMDVDIQTTPFTVVGVGDMSGDVFGNGMLLSPALKLVAAFDHRDIFIDPDPDPATSLAERRRLFELSRSSWQDYDRKLISKGGGVFSRHEKAIALTPQIRSLLELSGERATPPEVVRAILKARADLLFFGGIGTFVRASEETDDKVGDRANDAVRITGKDLRVKVVGEGANLAMTQRGRIEYGLAGGRCNSDAIDNSAGVNTSDVEVNIKIALGRAVRAGRLDLKRRNTLLAAMTDEVAALVLRNNYLQTLAISLTERRGFEDFGYQKRLMQSLEARGLLDRAVEALPDDAAMAERQKNGQPLTRSEIGVLLAYAKIVLNDDLLAARVADDTTLDNELVDYFPKKMRAPYREDIEAHRLRAEIIATVLANSMINRGGPTYLVRIGDRTGATPLEIARAYVAVRDAFALRDLNGAIDKLDNKIPGGLQLELYRVAEDLVLEKTLWFLRNASFADGIGPVVAAYGESVAAVAKMLGSVLPKGLNERLAGKAKTYESSGVPAALALRLARLPVLADATDIHLVAVATKSPLESAAATYFAAGEAFRFARLEHLASALAITDYYDGLARDRALETLSLAQRLVATAALAAGGLDGWRAGRADAVKRIMDAVAVMTEAEELTVSRLTVAANLLADLART